MSTVGSGAPEAAPFWDGIRRGEVLLPSCTACEQVFFYPRLFCPRCYSTEIRWASTSGRGVLEAFAVGCKHGFGIDPPFVVGLVRLVEGPVLTCSIRTAEVSVGCDVEVDPVETAEHGRLVVRAIEPVDRTTL